ncbi:MAG: NIPSNAP family protein [Terriglobia bacterium]
MERRKFLTSTLAASALAAGPPTSVLRGAEDSAGQSGREYYELRQYHFESGSQAKLTHAFLRDALIPALGRLGVGPVGVFNIHIGPEGSRVFVLLPCRSLETLANVDAQLWKDSVYLQAGNVFLTAAASAPAYVRMESKLMIAFEGRPKLAVPPATAERRPRTFELRTYESPSDRDHKRKVEMFHHGEFDIFRQAGFWPVFYGNTLVGTRLPNLTYMLAFDSLAERDKLWATFGSNPQWKKLSSSPRYAFEGIVSNVDNLILSPAPYSQI